MTEFKGNNFRISDTDDGIPSEPEEHYLIFNP